MYKIQYAIVKIVLAIIRKSIYPYICYIKEYI